jgi:hypothetical protein
MKRQDLLHQQFHRLKVIALAPSVKRQVRWRCRCECGRSTVVSAGNLRTGNTTSCGKCSRSDAAKKGWITRRAQSQNARRRRERG